MSEELKTIKIKLDGAGVVYEGVISPVVAAAVLKLCLATPESGLASITRSRSEVVDSGENVSLGEYVHRYQPTTYPQKILAIAAYQQSIRNMESISPEDIRPLFKSIGEVPPRNFSRDLWIAVSNTWLAQEGGTFWVTKNGFAALDSNFSIEQTRKVRRSKKGNSVSGAVNTQNDRDEENETVV